MWVGAMASLLGLGGLPFLSLPIYSLGRFSLAANLLVLEKRGVPTWELRVR